MEQKDRRSRTTSDRKWNTEATSAGSIGETGRKPGPALQMRRIRDTESSRTPISGSPRMEGTESRRRQASGKPRQEEAEGRRRQVPGSSGLEGSRSQAAAARRRQERPGVQDQQKEAGGSNQEAGRRKQTGQGARNRSPQRSGMNRPPARKQQSRRKRKRNLIIKAALIVILVIAAVVGAFLWKKYSPSKKEYDLKKYYGIENEGQLAVIVDNQVAEPHGMIADGKAYVQYEIVRDYINDRFYWDPNENVLLYTLPKDMVTVEVGSKDYSVSKEKKSEDYVILKTEGSTAYIALDFIQQYTNIEYELYNEPNRVMIVSDWGETTVAAVKKNTQVRYQGGVKSPILSQVKKKDEVTVIESEENWKKVRTKDGFIGYIKNSALRKEEKKVISRAFDEQEFTSIQKEYTINMAWHNVTNTDANNSVLQRIAESKGLTTIAPTWFHVKDTDGNMDSIASSDYVNYAHQSNIEVWAAIRDFDGGINSYEESYELLRFTSKRENLINQLISEALRVGVDGINVDFEKISEECGEHYIQFIRELSVRCRQNGIVLSIDNYVPKGYNMQYNRKEQGIVADYVVIMGYDEHYAGSPVAGPVSSYNFVKEGIEETLKEVPADKVISGIPFFTRLWEEVPKTEEELANQAGTEEAQYTTKVTSQAFDMNTAKAKLAEAGIETTWDENAQQNYATWVVESATFEMWLEDEQSIEPKLKLMKDNKLAGTAAWALGYENGEIWNLIQKYVN